MSGVEADPVKAALRALDDVATAPAARLSAAVAAATSAMRRLHTVPPPPGARLGTWWHGGVAGLRRGDRLLPPATTGAVPSDSAARPDRVYVTRRFGSAVFYAVPSLGWVYAVTPVGAVELDPQDPKQHLAYMVPEAAVLGVAWRVPR